MLTQLYDDVVVVEESGDRVFTRLKFRQPITGDDVTRELLQTPRSLPTKCSKNKFAIQHFSFAQMELPCGRNSFTHILHIATFGTQIYLLPSAFTVTRSRF